MNQLARSMSRVLTPSRLRNLAARRHSKGLRPLLEGLENRTVLSSVTWVGSNGGDWDTATNWSPVGVPTATEDVVISPSSAETIVHGMNQSDSMLSLTTNSNATLNVVQGSLKIGADKSILSGPVSVALGTTLSVATGASLAINSTLTDSGTLSFAASDAVTFSASQISVYGTMTATGDTFTNTYATSTIQVYAGGELKATNSSFNLSQVGWAEKSVMGASDLTGDTFAGSGYATSLSLPYGDVQDLANNAAFGAIDILDDTLPSGGSLTLSAIGGGSALQYIFPNGFTAASGGAINVGAGVKVLVGGTLTDSGTLSFAATDAVTFSASQISVYGTMTATGDTFTNTYATSTIQVYAGGELKATNSSFNLSQVGWAEKSVMGASDLTGDTFAGSGYATSLSLPYGDVQDLASNAAFGAIDILDDTLPSGGTLTLSAIGGGSALQYVFPNGFTAASGGAINVGAGVKVLVEGTLTDSGTLSFAASDAVTFSASQISVYGTMTATGDTFTNTYATSTIQVYAGGELKATNSTFNLSQVGWAEKSVMGASDLTGDTFAGSGYATSLSLPYGDVQDLANNAAFGAIDILDDTLPSGGTLTLSAIGGGSALQYVFPNGFTAASGGAINVGAGVKVLVGGTLTDSGTLSFAASDAVTFSASQISVYGTMTATGDTFTNTYATSTIQVYAGGELKATSSTFNLSQVALAQGSVLKSGDLAGDTFSGSGYSTPLSLPYQDVQDLGGNAAFGAVDILADTIPSGGELTLNPIPGGAAASYVFPSGFTVSAGGALVVGTSVNLLIESTLTDGGLLIFASGDVVSFSAATIAVNGTMTATGDTFTNTYATSTIQVNSGGNLNASNNIFGLSSLNLTSGSSGQLATDVFNTTLNINSGTTAGVTGNDFTNGKVAASGNPNATITLTNNYWGTTTPAQIAAKITSTGPTVSYTPFLSAASPLGTATVVVATSTTATYNANASQSVTLTASLTSGSAKPGAGTVTFVLVNGTSMIGDPVTAAVSGGSASTTILLPAGTQGGTDTILAIYNGTASYIGSIDASHTVTVNPAATTTAAAAAADTYNSLGAQTVNLGATVTSSGGTVNQGTETFTILTGSTPVGSPVTVNVVNGAAGATYSVPAGTSAGTYTVKAVYNGTADFKASSDTAHSLTVAAAATTTASVNTSTTYGASSRTVALTAAVTGTAGTVAQGTVTFTILSGSTTIGSPVSASVSGGSASANYTLPAGLAGGTYTIKAAYSGGTDFGTSSDSSHTLTVGAAATTTAAKSVTITYSSSAQAVTLSATVTSSAGTVGEGSETFTVLNGTAVIGAATTGNVAGGSVSVSYTIPAGTAVGAYTIKAVYNGTAEYLTATDTSHVLTINSATAAIPAAAAAVAIADPAPSVTVAAPAAPAPAATTPGTTVDVAAARRRRTRCTGRPPGSTAARSRCARPRPRCTRGPVAACWSRIGASSP